MCIFDFFLSFHIQIIPFHNYCLCIKYILLQNIFFLFLPEKVSVMFFCFVFLCRPDCILGFSPVINHLWICPHVLYCIILNAVHRNPYYSWENIGEILFIFQFFMSGLDVCIYFIFMSFLFWIQTVMCFSILFFNCIFRIILVANIC